MSTFIDLLAEVMDDDEDLFDFFKGFSLGGLAYEGRNTPVGYISYFS